MRNFPHWGLSALVLTAALMTSCGDDAPAPEACTTGAEGCACTAGNGCDPGLTCATGLCVSLSGDDLGDSGSGDVGADDAVGERTLCTNTCETPNDSECDDGGPGSLYSICDFGTDCADCGPRALEGDGDIGGGDAGDESDQQSDLAEDARSDADAQLRGPCDCLWPGTTDIEHYFSNVFTDPSTGDVWVAGFDGISVIRCETGLIETRAPLLPSILDGDLIGVTPSSLAVMVYQVEETYTVIWVDGDYEIVSTVEGLLQPRFAQVAYFDGRGHAFLVIDGEDGDTINEYDSNGAFVASFTVDFDLNAIRGGIEEGLLIKLKGSEQGVCGDERQTRQEFCDTDVQHPHCYNFQLGDGDVTCLECRGYDVTGCSESSYASCGDNEVQGYEVCDGTALGKYPFSSIDGAPYTCEALGYLRGDISCESNCLALDVSGCDDGIYRLIGGELQRVATRWPEPPNNTTTLIPDSYYYLSPVGEDAVYELTVTEWDAELGGKVIQVRRMGLDGEVIWESVEVLVSQPNRNNTFIIQPDGDVVIFFYRLRPNGTSGGAHFGGETFSQTHSAVLARFDGTTGELMFVDGTELAGEGMTGDACGSTYVVWRRTRETGLQIAKFDADMEEIGASGTVDPPSGSCDASDIETLLGTDDVQVVSYCQTACVYYAAARDFSEGTNDEGRLQADEFRVNTCGVLGMYPSGGVDHKGHCTPYCD